MLSKQFKSLAVLFSILCLSLISHAETQKNEMNNLPVIVQQIFLKMGFSSVIEFDEEPEKIILGDSQNFQVEKTNKSLVVRGLTPFASSNLFVYFKNYSTQIFSLTTDEDANPTLIKKVFLKELVIKGSSKDSNEMTKSKSIRNNFFGLRLIKKEFSKSKDYLTLDYYIGTDSSTKLEPYWKGIRLRCDKTEIPPYKTWSERETIQKETLIKARVIFLRPNISSKSKCILEVPLKDKNNNLKMEIK